MKKAERSLADYIDRFNNNVGRCASWLTIIMVLLMSISVVQRYFLNSNHIWQQELLLFIHSFVFMAAAGYTLLDDEHVRVGVVYEKLDPVRKAWVDLLGTILFLIPVAIALIYFSYGFVLSSWQIMEKSRESDGMPGIFILKSFIWLFSFVIILQAISVIARSIRTISCLLDKRVKSD